jgi:hypothetical protein
MSDEQPSEETVRTSALNPAMRRVLIIVGIVVAISIGVAVWFLTAPSRDGETGAGADPQPSFSSSVTQGPIPGGIPTSGSEVQDPDPSAPPLDRLPSRAPAAPLVPSPFPDAGRGMQNLVDGFPTNVMGPVSGSDIVENSIATEGTTMQVTLVARSEMTQQEISDYYSTLWSSLGLGQQSTSDSVLGFASSFESLSLAFVPSSGTGTVYMIYGTFRAA